MHSRQRAGAKGRTRKPGQKRTYTVWEPCSPAAVRIARDAYGRWHAALRQLAKELDGMLDGYRITELAAPERPWECLLCNVR
jgi:hypothetical protein